MTREILFFKNYAENEVGPPFLIKNLNMSWIQVVCSLISIYFDRPQLTIQ